jgi:ABC-2 type transport system ATP-binding protein
VIHIKNLSKTFWVHEKAPGLKASLTALVKRRVREVRALAPTSLDIEAGEIVGLVGSNGAGKTTLTKMLAGVVYPTGGDATVLGYTPWKRENAYRRQMSLVMGQKNQLWWDLPAGDCFLLLKEVYEITPKDFQGRLQELARILEVDSLLETPVRRLSLGERMKMELIAALLHRPRVVFLDEPTIGLDITAQKTVRRFLKQYQEEYRPVMLLTSHYMQDISELCRRVVILKQGAVVYDGSLGFLREKYLTSKHIVASLQSEITQTEITLEGVAVRVTDDGQELQAHVPKDIVPQFIAALFAQYPVKDMNVHAEDVGLIIERVMRGGTNAL